MRYLLLPFLLVSSLSMASAAELRVSSGSDHEIRVLPLSPEESGVVTVYVNSAGHSPDNFIVTLVRSGDSLQVVERRRTGANGTVRFRDVPPGDYRVTLKQQLEQPDSYEVTIGDVVLSKAARAAADGVREEAAPRSLHRSLEPESTPPRQGEQR